VLLQIGLKLIHQSCAIPSNLLAGCDGQECNLYKISILKLPEDNSTNDLLTDGIFLVFDDHHRLVDAVKHKPDNVLFGHFRELFSDNSFKVDECFHGLMRFIIFEYFKLHDIVVLLNFDSFVPRQKTNSNL